MSITNTDQGGVRTRYTKSELEDKNWSEAKTESGLVVKTKPWLKLNIYEIKEKSELGTETRVQSVLGKTTETRNHYKDKSWNLIQ